MISVNSDGKAISTSTTTTDDCIVPSGGGAAGLKRMDTNLHINHSDVNYSHFSAGSDAIWNQLFTLDRIEMQGIAEQESNDLIPLDERTVIWETSTAIINGAHPIVVDDQVGSPTNPIILIIDSAADCPKFNGGITVYGVIFIDSECSSATGWGGADIYGIVAFNGDVTQLNSNTEFYTFNDIPGGGNTHNLKLPASRVLGSWKDF